MVKKQSGNKIKMLGTNSGGEYASLNFSSFCEKKGIIHEFTPPYALKHNGTIGQHMHTIQMLLMFYSRMILQHYKRSLKIKLKGGPLEFQKFNHIFKTMNNFMIQL